MDEIEIQCSLECGEPFPRSLTEDVIESLSVSGIGIKSHEYLNEKTIKLTCKLECLSLIEPTEVIMRKTFTFYPNNTSNIPEPPRSEIETFWYVSSNGGDIPTTIVQENLAQKVYSTCAITIGIKQAASSSKDRWEYSCASTDMPEVIKYASNIRLSGFSFRLIPPTQSLELLPSSLSYEKYRAENIYFTELSEQYLQCDSKYAEIQLKSLCIHMSYELRKLESDYTDLRGDYHSPFPTSIEEDNYSRSLMSSEAEKQCFVQIEKCMLSEGLQSELVELKSIAKLWEHSVQKSTAHHLAGVKNLVQTLINFTQDFTLLAVITPIKDSCTWSGIYNYMRRLKYHSLKSRSYTLIVANILSAYIEARRELTESYKALEKHCAKLLNTMRPVDLQKLLELARKFPNKISEFTGKNVIALLGNTGVGKSTAIQYLHGGRFEVERNYRDHYIVKYTDEQLQCAGPNLLNIASGSSSSSTTYEVNATQMTFNDREWLVLDTPGFGDTNGVEFDIINGLNISAALKASACLKLVIVLSDYCLGDKLLRGTDVKDCCRTVLNMFETQDTIKRVKSLSYLFTKMERWQAPAISALFKTASSMLGNHEKDIEAVWTDIAEKTVSGAMMVCPLTDTEADRQVVYNYIFSNDFDLVIDEPATVIGHCLGRDSRNLLSNQLKKVYESIAKVLKMKNVGLLTFYLEQLKNIRANPTLAVLPECKSAYEDCVKLFLKEVEDKFATLKQLAEFTSPLSDRQLTNLTEAFELVCVFDESRRQLQYESRSESCNNLQIECRLLLQRYIDNTSKLLHTYFESRFKWKHMQYLKDLISQLLKLKKSLENSQPNSCVACADVVSVLNLYLSANGALRIINNLKNQLQMKFDSGKEKGNLVDCLKCLNDAQHFETTFMSLITELSPDDIVAPFYNRMKETFLTLCNSLQDVTICALSTNDGEQCDSPTNSIRKMSAFVQYDENYLRTAVVAFNQLLEFLSIPKLDVSRSSTEMLMHLDDFNVQEICENISAKALLYFKYIRQLFSAVNPSEFSIKDNKETLQGHYQKIEALSKFPFSNSTDLEQEVEEIFRLVFKLCQNLSDTAEMQLNTLITSPKECDGDLLIKCVDELHDSAYFHKNLHYQIAIRAMNRIELLHRQQLKRKGKCEIQSLAVANFSSELLRTAAITACGGKDFNIENLDMASSSAVTIKSSWKEVESCAITLRMLFNEAFFDNGCYKLDELYSSLQSNFQSLATYVPILSEYRTKERAINKFLQGCDAAQWCFPDDAGNGQEKVPSPTKLLFSEVRQRRKKSLHAQFEEIEIHLRESFRWLVDPYSNKLMQMLNEQTLNIPLSNEVSDGVPTSTNLVDALEYLQIYESEAKGPIGKLTMQLTNFSAILNGQLEACNTAVNVIENIAKLAQDLERLDRFIPADSSFKELAKVAKGKILSAKRDIRSAVENHDFKTFGIAIDDTNESHKIFIESLVREVDDLLKSICLGPSLFTTLSKLHSAHEYCGRFLRKQLLANIKDKIRVVKDECIKIMGEASSIAEKGCFRECMQGLLKIQEVFVNSKLRTSHHCSVATNDNMVVIIGCILCSADTTPVISDGEGMEVQCNHCSVIQLAGISSRDFQFVTQSYTEIQKHFDGCVKLLKERLSPDHTIRDICSEFESESDKEDDDFNNQYSRDDMSSISRSNASKNGWLLQSVCTEMEYFKKNPLITSSLDIDINAIDAGLEKEIRKGVMPLIEKAKKIAELVNEGTTKELNVNIVVSELTIVRSSLTKLKKLKNLIGLYFAPYREDYKIYANKLKAAEKSLKDSQQNALRRGDLKTLLSKFGESPQISALLEKRFQNFEKVFEKVNSSDLNIARALQLIRVEGRQWHAFSPERTEVAVNSLLEQYEKVRPVTRQLVRLQEAEIQFIRDNFNLFVEFIHSAGELEHIAKEETVRQVKRTQEYLKDCVVMCYTNATVIESALNSFEAVIPLTPEAAYSSSAFIGTNDLYRLQSTWSQVNEYGDIIRLITSTLNDPKEFAFLESTHIVKIKLLLGVHNRIAAIRSRCETFLKLPFANSKTDTLNRSDKDSFYSLIYFCYKFVGFFWDDSSKETIVKMEQVNNDIKSKLEQTQNDCLPHISNINSSMDLNSDCFAYLDKAIGNLESVRHIFIEFQTVANRVLAAINERFDVKLRDILKDAELSESEWANWVTYKSKLSKQLILLKAISRSIPAFRPNAENAINGLLVKYRQRCASDDIENDFIAKLGTDLEQSSSNGLGQKIIEDTPIFAGYKNWVRNVQFSRIDLEGTISTIDSENEKARLRKLYADFDDRYWKLVDSGLPKDKRANTIKSIPKKVKETASNVRILTAFDEIAESILNLVVYSFAYWTLNNLDGYDTTPSTKLDQQKFYLTQPHPGQIIVVLRLLGLDADKLQAPSAVAKATRVATDFLMSFFTAKEKCKVSFKNHLAEIRTGEGKSVVLAVTATVLALLDYSVDIACYSEYLTDRDKGTFDFMFKDFNVNEHVQYNTFKNLCESLLLSQGDIREFMGDTILGKSTSQFQSKMKQILRPKILLVDEVDVLFGSNFFGKSYNVFSSLKGSEVPEIVNLVKLIWTFRNSKLDSIWFDSIIPSPEYQACLKRFEEWPFLIESAAMRMLYDVRDLDHKVDEISPLKGIGYFDEDNQITFSKRDGYKTLFAYINENEKDKTMISDAQVLEETNILVNAGTLSYAELPKLYSVTLGVSGTLHTLSREEKRLLEREYEIVKWTTMPSAYPSYTTSNIPAFAGKFGVDIIASNSATFFANIANEIRTRIADNRGKKRAVLVFFQKDSILEDFSTSDVFKEYTASALKIVKKTRPEDRDSAIARAVEEGRVTLLIAAYGRGTDFTYNNKELDERGGIHVIQTFLSEESAEETQIRGRTNRQGHPGSFSMVLSDSDFEAVGIKQSDIAKFRVGQEIFEQIKSFRNTKYAKKCAERKELADFMRIEHEESNRILEELWKNDLAGVKKRIAARNQARIEFVRVVSRTVILLDATGSMAGFFCKCKTIVKEMLKRICEILKEQNATCGFEVQFVVYRNYPSKTLLLQASNWESDPEVLKEFIDKTEVSGGVGGNESIETAFCYVNQQIEKGVDVTQVIIIGDQGPNNLNQIDILRGSVESDNLKGEEFWKQKTAFKVKTHYKPELKKLKDKGIPIHARYLNVRGSFPAKDSFEEFAKDNGGSVGELEIDKPKGAEQLTGLFAAGILKNIQSRSKNNCGVDLYRAYLAKHPNADVGFV